MNDVGTLKLLVIITSGLLLFTACHHRETRVVAPEKQEVAWRGVASWYGADFHGRTTASGERYNMHAMTAAHRTLPFGSMVEVRNRHNGRRVRVRINDRGPFVGGRIIDLSYAAAKKLGMIRDGVTQVEVKLLNANAEGGIHQKNMCFAAQVGSFRRRKNAERLRRDLQGIMAQIHLERSADSFWRVRIGCYGARAEADVIAALLRRRGYDAFIVQRRRR